VGWTIELPYGPGTLEYTMDLENWQIRTTIKWEVFAIDDPMRCPITLEFIIRFFNAHSLPSHFGVFTRNYYGHWGVIFPSPDFTILKVLFF